jgi:mannose-6-phosphate isomerase
LDATLLYPLRFEPLYRYRPWGGRRLAEVLSVTLPGADPIGEAWILSDREEHSSVIANGPLKGVTLSHLVSQCPDRLFGNECPGFNRFPLLLKFLDARAALSVQVHPADRQTEYLPAGESGKTEAWVILAVGHNRRVYVGLNPGTTPDLLRESLATDSLMDLVASFDPAPGDAVFVPAGTVHSLRDAIIFEVQENSNVTFRLYDWNHLDPKTHRLRPLQVEQAIACINYLQGPVAPIVPVIEQCEPSVRERLFDCEQFKLWRVRGKSPFVVGRAGAARVLVCTAGQGHLKHNDVDFPFRTGEVLLLAAEVGTCLCCPSGDVELLEIAPPHGRPAPIKSPLASTARQFR